MSVFTFPSGGRLGFFGVTEAFDRHFPIAGKDEFGMDTLTRTLCVPAPALSTFELALRQGQTYDHRGTVFYLQTWQPSSDPCAPEFSMTYKGLLNGIPDPLISIDRPELVSSLSASGLNVTYSGKTIIAARSEVRYIAPSTNYRYIANNQPLTPRYNSVKGGTIQTLGSVTTVEFSDGTSRELGGSAPAAVSTALFRTPVAFTIGPIAREVRGSPYWEAEEIVQLKYPD